MPSFTAFLFSRPRLFVSILVGVVAAVLLPPSKTHYIIAWDVAAAVFLCLWFIKMQRTPPSQMPANAKAQQDGEWTVFALSLAAVIASVFAIFTQFHDIQSLKGALRAQHLVLVVVTLLLSWLVMQVIFALRYAHEYYTISDGSTAADGGLDFPHEPEPDYFDFLYFGLVLGMTFQVSDVDITSRKLRRLATLQGFVSFLFNTVILALTVNLMAGLL
jgi:uncharacterized membrane protein